MLVMASLGKSHTSELRQMAENFTMIMIGIMTGTEIMIRTETMIGTEIMTGIMTPAEAMTVGAERFPATTSADLTVISRAGSNIGRIMTAIRLIAWNDA